MKLFIVYLFNLIKYSETLINAILITVNYDDSQKIHWTHSCTSVKQWVLIANLVIARGFSQKTVDRSLNSYNVCY